MKQRISGPGRYRLGPLMGVLAVAVLAITPLIKWSQTAASEKPQNSNATEDARSGAPIAPVVKMPDQKAPAAAANQGSDTEALSEASREVADKKAVGVPEGAAGMRVYVNPNTGRFEDPPADVRAAMAAAGSSNFNTSTTGLQETPSSVPGGGIRLNLQGRFRIPLVATRSADGELTIDHPSMQPTSQEE